MTLLSIPALPAAVLAAILGLWIAFAVVGQYSHNYRRLDFMAGRGGTYVAVSSLSLLFHVCFAIYLGYATVWWMPFAMLPAVLLGSFLVIRLLDAAVFGLGGPQSLQSLNAAIGAPALLWKAVVAIAMIAIIHSSPTPAETLSFLTAS